MSSEDIRIKNQLIKFYHSKIAQLRQEINDLNKSTNSAVKPKTTPLKNVATKKPLNKLWSDLSPTKQTKPRQTRKNAPKRAVKPK